MSIDIVHNNKRKFLFNIPNEYKKRKQNKRKSSQTGNLGGDTVSSLKFLCYYNKVILIVITSKNKKAVEIKDLQVIVVYICRIGFFVKYDFLNDRFHCIIFLCDREVVVCDNVIHVLDAFLHLRCCFFFCNRFLPE